MINYITLIIGTIICINSCSNEEEGTKIQRLFIEIAENFKLISEEILNIFNITSTDSILQKKISNLYYTAGIYIESLIYTKYKSDILKNKDDFKNKLDSILDYNSKLKLKENYNETLYFFSGNSYELTKYTVESLINYNELIMDSSQINENYLNNSIENIESAIISTLVQFGNFSAFKIEIKLRKIVNLCEQIKKELETGNIY